MTRKPLDHRAAAGAAMLGVIVLLAILAPVMSHPDRNQDVVSMRFLAPLAHDPAGVLHLLGTDRLGRDVWARLLFGARISLSVGVLTMVLSLGIGVVVGTGAAYTGTLLNASLLGLTDFMLGVPRVVLLLLLAALWEPNATEVVLVLAATGWMPIARLIFAETQSQRAQPYVESVEALGASPVLVWWRHVLPHATPAVMAAVTLGVGNAIMLEAGLSFLGLGVQPPAVSWGSLIASGRDTVVNAPWVGLAPGIALVLVVVGCTLVADGIQERGQA